MIRKYIGKAKTLENEHHLLKAEYRKLRTSYDNLYEEFEQYKAKCYENSDQSTIKNEMQKYKNIIYELNDKIKKLRVESKQKEDLIRKIENRSGKESWLSSRAQSKSKLFDGQKKSVSYDHFHDEELSNNENSTEYSVNETIAQAHSKIKQMVNSLIFVLEKNKLPTKLICYKKIAELLMESERNVDLTNKKYEACSSISTLNTERMSPKVYKRNQSKNINKENCYQSLNMTLNKKCIEEKIKNKKPLFLQKNTTRPGTSMKTDDSNFRLM